MRNSSEAHPAIAPVGRGNVEGLIRCVSRGMLIAAAGGGSGEGSGTVVTVVVFSSSSKNTSDGMGSTEEQAPAVPVWLVVRSRRNVAVYAPAATVAEPRHTIQLEVMPAPSK